MEFRDLKEQYRRNKEKIDTAIQKVLLDSDFISGSQVNELEVQLAEYVGVKHCITCGNGTDALQLALMTWNIGKGDAVFIPDFTFFSSGEVVPVVGATPVFVDVEEDTFNICADSLEMAIEATLKHTDLIPKVIVAVDLFGQPADFPKIRELARKYHMYILEDAAQGFGGAINQQKACRFGDIATTSFFPAKPLGCYGDGGAVFTDNDEWAALLKSYRVHGKGTDKYDNVRIGMNSRLDTIQAAVLQVKLELLQDYELEAVNLVAQEYTKHLENIVKTPYIMPSFLSSWAQYSILCHDEKERDLIQNSLKQNGIPAMIYYKKPMHEQQAFGTIKNTTPVSLEHATGLCKRVLSLPMHPYLGTEDVGKIVGCVKNALTKSYSI